MNKVKEISPSELLANQFLERVKKFNANVELIKVLKSRTYSIGEASVLVREASEGNRRYFFGLNYLHVEEISNLDNPFVAFICGFVANENLGGLYAEEKNLRELRYEVGL